MQSRASHLRIRSEKSPDPTLVVPEFLLPLAGVVSQIIEVEEKAEFACKARCLIGF